MMRYAIVVLMLVCSMVGSAQSPAAPPNGGLRFEAASVKRNDSRYPGSQIRHRPDLWEASNVPLQLLILDSYNLQAHQLIGGPDWVRTQNFDVKATAARDATSDEMRSMMRTLLSERFKFVAHTETREVPGWDMVLENKKLGPALRLCQKDCTGRGLSMASGRIVNEDASMSFIAALLTTHVNAPVVDRSGLEGRYAFELTIPQGQRDVVANDAAFVNAVREQLGLKLEPSRITLDALVIDSVELPTPD